MQHKDEYFQLMTNICSHAHDSISNDIVIWKNLNLNIEFLT